MKQETKNQLDCMLNQYNATLEQIASLEIDAMHPQYAQYCKIVDKLTTAISNLIMALHYVEQASGWEEAWRFYHIFMLEPFIDKLSAEDAEAVKNYSLSSEKARELFLENEAKINNL